MEGWRDRETGRQGDGATGRIGEGMPVSVLFSLSPRRPVAPSLFQQLPDQLQILPGLAFLFSDAQQIGRIEGRQERYLAIIQPQGENLATQLRNSFFRSEQRLRGERAQRHDDAWVDRQNLSQQERAAIFDLLDRKFPLTGRNAFDQDRKSTRLNSSHLGISYAVFCLKKKKKIINSKLYNIT